MNLDLSPAEEVFGGEVREFIARELPHDIRATPRRKRAPFCRAFSTAPSGGARAIPTGWVTHQHNPVLKAMEVPK